MRLNTFPLGLGFYLYKMKSRILLAYLFCFFSCLPGLSLAQVSILTQRYGVDRLGWNQHEKTLTTANVRPETFGALYNYTVDDQVYAQPLLLSGVFAKGAVRNLLVAATVNNTVYVYDADSANVLIWQRNLNRANNRAPLNTDMTGACGGFYFDFSGHMGIIGTPVIDSATNTLYVLHREISTSLTNPSYAQFLHAIDIATGIEKADSPVQIAASVKGSGSGSTGGNIYFDAQKNNQRTGLLLHQGVVYIGWASHCDWGPYHGWLLGYDAQTLKRRVIYNSTPDGEDGGIWMSGCAPTVGPDGDIYLTTGNGTVGASGDPNNARNRGESILRLRNVHDTLKVISFFTPANYGYLEANDLDYGSDGAIMIPGSDLVLSGSKDGNIYVNHADSMKGYSSNNSSAWQQFRANVQALSPRHIHGTPVYNAYIDTAGKTIERIFVWAESDSLKSLQFNRSTMQFDLQRMAKGHVKLDNGMPGSMLCSSSNGQAWGSTILWAAHPRTGDANHSTRPGRLQAYDPRNISTPIYSSDMVSSRDDAGSFSKFNTPVVANGRVYLATFSRQIKVYGLLSSNPNGLPKNVPAKFFLRPNPASTQLEFGFASSEKTGLTEVAVLDPLGRQLFRHKLDATLVLDLPSGWAPGLYLAQFYIDGKPAEQVRWVKQ
jgi:hypothetical protein